MKNAIKKVVPKVKDLVVELSNLNRRYIFVTTVLILIILATLYYFYKIYTSESRELRRKVKNSYSLWDYSPISTSSYFEVEPDDIPDPEEDEATYAMMLKISKWTHGEHNKELFQHGESKSCSLTNNDIMRMEFDSKVNDIHLNVLTNSGCKDIVGNVLKFAVSNSNVYCFNFSKTLFKRKSTGEECWKKINIQNTPQHLTLKDITVINEKHREIVYLIYEESDTYNFSVYELTNTALSDQYVLENIFETDNVDNPAQNILGFSAVNLNNGKYLFYFQFTFSVSYFSVYDTNSTDPKSNFENNFSHVNSNINVLDNMPIESDEYIFTLDKKGFVLFAKKSEVLIFNPENQNNSNPSYQLSDFYKLSQERNVITSISHKFTSITCDNKHLWGIEKNTLQKLYSFKIKNLLQNSWVYMNNPPLNQAILKIDTSEKSKLWFTIKDFELITQLHPTSKCSPVQIGNTNKIDNFSTSSENITIKNVPIGKKFHLAVTLTKKRVDIFINGKLYKTHIYNGEKPLISNLKSFRFFGSSHKLEGYLSNFKYFPFHISHNLIHLLYKQDKMKSRFLDYVHLV